VAALERDAYAGPVNPVSLRRRLVADAALFLVAVVWGTTFPLAKYILTHIPPFLYLTVRFGLAALVLLPFAYLVIRRLPGRLWLKSIGVGVALGVGFVFQTVGLQTAGATVSAFLTGLSVVLVPVLGIFWGRSASGREWIGVAAATVGLALLTLQGPTRPGLGELLVLGCAFCFAIQILLLDRVAAEVPPLPLGAIQVFVVAMLCLPFLPAEPPTQSAPVAVWLAIAALAVFATAGAFTLQSWAQRFTVPTHVGLIFAFEPVAAAVFARWWLGEELFLPQWIGAGLILAGIVLAETAAAPADGNAGPGASR
jgi:drug/metabolite transporter (DMT)-like permease